MSNGRTSGRVARQCGICRLAGAAVATLGVSGCDQLTQILEALQGGGGAQTAQIALVLPNADRTVSLGATVTIRWADLAYNASTFVDVSVERFNETGTLESTPLVSGRDALADGNGDIVEWDTTGFALGTYRVRVTITDPDVVTQSVVSNAIITIQN